MLLDVQLDARPDLAADRAAHAAQADPVINVLAAMGSLPAGHGVDPRWRAVSQLVLRPAPEDWARGYERLALVLQEPGGRILGAATLDKR